MISAFMILLFDHGRQQLSLLSLSVPNPNARLIQYYSVVTGDW